MTIEVNRAEAEGIFKKAEERVYAGVEPCDDITTGSGGSRKIIASRANVSEQLVQRAITIKKHRPDLFQRIFNGWYDDLGKEVPESHHQASRLLLNMLELSTLGLFSFDILLLIERD